MTVENIKLTIIIVSWNCRELLETCLMLIERYKDQLRLEVIVVDNASKDGTPEMLRGLKQPYIRAVLSNENLGFARGNNLGLEQARGEYILLLNPDTEIRSGLMRNLVKFMDSHERCGALGPKLLNPDGSLQLSVRNFPTLLSQLLVLTKVHNFVPGLRPLRKYFQLDFDYDKAQPVEAVMGAALMTRREVINQVGTLDSKYRRIFEEVDFCQRVMKAAWKNWYTPTGEVIHHKGTSFAKVRIFRKQLDFNQGMRRFFWQHKPKWQYLVILIFQPVSWLVTGLQVILSKLGDPLRRRYKKQQL